MTTKSRKLKLIRSTPDYLKTWLKEFRATVSRPHRQSLIDEVDLGTALATLNKPANSEYPPLLYLAAAKALQGLSSTGETNLYLSEIARHFTISLMTVEKDLLAMEALLVQGQRAWHRHTHAVRQSEGTEENTDHETIREGRR